jgi:hypothetical protein
MTQVDDAFIADWVALEARSVEENAFLSPHFVLPALKYLDPRKRVVLLGIHRSEGGADQLIGVGPFVTRPPMARFPLPHLEAYRSPHTFLTGILLDRDHQWLALSALGAYLSSAHLQWCGVEFEDRLADGALDQIYRDDTVTSLVRWSEYYQHRRAILVPATAPESVATLLTSGNLGKELRRKRRRLEEKGEITWQFRAGKDVTPECIETFLRLEDQGWRAEDGKSMLSKPGHADFFREAFTRFANAGRAFFTELSLNGQVIASTSNLISGDVGFAFKIGWDTRYASVSPGLLNELEMMRHAGEHLHSFRFIDSGAAEGSFIEQLWRDCRYVSTGILTGGYAGAAVLPAISIARRLKRGWS